MTERQKHAVDWLRFHASELGGEGDWQIQMVLGYITQLEAELEKAKADSKRLDWLIKTKCFVYCSKDEDWMVCAPDPGDGFGEYDVEGGLTWREAVDNSMKSWDVSTEESHE